MALAPASYNASKFAVRGFTEALRQEMAGSNLGVSCVHPGGIATAIVASARHPQCQATDHCMAVNRGHRGDGEPQ